MFSTTRQPKLLSWLVRALLISGVALGLCGCGTISAATQAVDVSASVEHSKRTTTRPATTGEREPMPVGNIPGWRQVFTDDFNGRSLNMSKWRLYWGTPGGDPAGWYDPRHITVSNGMLVISAYRDRRDHDRWATGGLSSSPGLVQTYGKYLVRFRFAPGIGVGHALLLMPANGSWPPEIDFSEDNGSGRDSTLVTLHFGKHDTHWSKSLRVNLTQWHTLGVQWTPGELQYTIDGRIWATMKGSEVPDIPMVLDMQTESWPCTGTWGRCPNASTPKVVRLYVDWVVAYAPDGNTPGAPRTGGGA